MSYVSVAAPLLEQQIAFLHKSSMQVAHRGKKTPTFVIFLQLTNEICPPGCQGFH